MQTTEWTISRWPMLSEWMNCYQPGKWSTSILLYVGTTPPSLHFSTPPNLDESTNTELNCFLLEESFCIMSKLDALFGEGEFLFVPLHVLNIINHIFNSIF